MLKKVFLLFAISIFLISCATVPTTPPPAKTPQEIVVKVEAAEPTKLTVEEAPKERVNKSMEVPNPEGRLSQLSFISSDKAFVKIFSGLSVADVTRLWNDLVVLENNTQIRDVNLFINSPGGDAFSGLALADQIERAARLEVAVATRGAGSGSGICVSGPLHAGDLADDPSHHRRGKRTDVSVLCHHRPLGDVGTAVDDRTPVGGTVAPGGRCQEAIAQTDAGRPHPMWRSRSGAGRDGGHPVLVADQDAGANDPGSLGSRLADLGPGAPSPSAPPAPVTGLVQQGLYISITCRYASIKACAVGSSISFLLSAACARRTFARMPARTMRRTAHW